MAIYSNADVDALYRAAGNGPDRTYWAASFWCYFVSDRNDYVQLIGFTNTTSSDYFGMWLNADGSTIEVSSNADYSSPGSITVGAWHHFYIVNRNGSGSGGFRLATGTTYSTATCTGATVGSDLAFIINNDDADFNVSEFADARFAHVKVWSGVANIPTDEQLQVEGSAARPLVGLPVWAWWPLWDVNTMLVDYSGNGRTLTVSGSHTITDVDGPPVLWGTDPLPQLGPRPLPTKSLLWLPPEGGG